MQFRNNCVRWNMEINILLCPTCNGRYHTYSEAMECRDSHYPTMQKWLKCKCGFGVRCDGYAMASCVEEFERHKKQCSIVGGY